MNFCRLKYVSHYTCDIMQVCRGGLVHSVCSRAGFCVQGNFTPYLSRVCGMVHEHRTLSDWGEQHAKRAQVGPLDWFLAVTAAASGRQKPV